MDKKEFKIALEQRLAKRLKTQTFDEITVGGSKLRFEMAMAIEGHPFNLPDDAVKEDYSRLLTSEQYMSGEYESVLDEVFAEALDNQNN